MDLTEDKDLQYPELDTTLKTLFNAIDYEKIQNSPLNV